MGTKERVLSDIDHEEKEKKVRLLAHEKKQKRQHKTG